MVHRCRRRSPRARVGRVVAFVVLVATGIATPSTGARAGAGAGAGAGASAAPTPRAASALAGMELRPLSASADRRIVDDLGRDVLLRGANVNSLGEYWQGVPGLVPTIPVTDADWAAMASRGSSVVRLIITWSRIEPQPGQIDVTYLDAIDAQVTAAGSHGIYSVIDMHQDAYSPFVATTDPGTCAPGSTPGKGWDGAPAWATITDGASTCTPTGDRYSAPAVFAAFNHFYDNTNGIRDHFVASWAAVAARFSGRPEVAGFDLLNEPAVTRPAAELQPLYEELLTDVITAIREAEAGAAFEHLLFVEPALPMGDPSLGLVIPDPRNMAISSRNVVAAPHNYAESIPIAGLDLTIEALNELYANVTRDFGLPLWIGEYGFWDTDPATLDKVSRSAADEDRLLIGGAWWQWRQSCGDPHAVSWENGQVVAPSGVSTHLNRLDCPTNADLGPTEEFQRVLGRGFPRAAPGRLTSLRSDWSTGSMDVVATASASGGRLLVWSPTASGPAHPLTAENLRDLVETAVPGGRIIAATVASPGCYALHVASSAVSCPVAPIVEPSFTG